MDNRTQIEALETERGRPLLAHLTTTRPGVRGPLAMHALPVVHRHLREMGLSRDSDALDLFLHTNGGDVAMPWRLVSLLREHCRNLGVVLPHRAFSAGTLTALGADEIVMHAMAMLGPTDPTTTMPLNPRADDASGPLGVAAEDLDSFIDFLREDLHVGLDRLPEFADDLIEQVHPLSLGSVKRATRQARLIARLQLAHRVDDPLNPDQIESIVDRLAAGMHYHGHPINREEAHHHIGLSFVTEAEGDLADAVWNLYEQYEDGLDLERPFELVRAAVHETGGVRLPTEDEKVVREEVELPRLRTHVVESANRCDVYEQRLVAVVSRESNGSYKVAATEIERGWRQIR